MSANARPTPPLAAAMQSVGLQMPNQVDPSDINRQLSAFVNDVADSVKTKTAVEALQSLVAPKATDPIAQMSQTVDLIQKTAGLRSAAEEAELKRAERERMAEIEREKLEMQRADREAARETAAGSMVLKVMEMTQAQQAAAEERWRRILEDQDRKFRELAQQKQGSQTQPAGPDPIRDFANQLVVTKLSELAQPSQHPSPIEQLSESFGQIQKLSDMLGYGNRAPAVSSEEWAFRRWEHETNMRLEQQKFERQMEIEQKKAERNAGLLDNLLKVLPYLPNPFARAAGAAPIPDPMTTGAMATPVPIPTQGPPSQGVKEQGFYYQCPRPECRGQFALPVLVSNLTCPMCGESFRLDAPEPVEGAQA